MANKSKGLTALVVVVVVAAALPPSPQPADDDALNPAHERSRPSSPFRSTPKTGKPAFCNTLILSLILFDSRPPPHPLVLHGL